VAKNEKKKDDEEYIKTTIYLKKSTKKLYDNVAILMKKHKIKKEMDNEAISQYANKIIKDYNLEDKLVILD
jgi:hypothetical protein